MSGNIRPLTIGILGIGLLMGTGLSSAQAQGEEKSANPNEKRHNYFVAIYRPGPAWVEGKSVFEQPKIREHAMFMDMMRFKGIVVLGGPFKDNTGGICIFDFTNSGVAKKTIMKDPIIQNKIFTAEILSAINVGSEAKPAGAKKIQPNYFVAVYRPGPNWVKGKAMREQPKINEHGEYVGKLSDNLVYGGQLENDSGEVEGGFGIFDFGHAEEARKTLAKDPVVQAKIITLEIHPFYPIIPGPLEKSAPADPEDER